MGTVWGRRVSAVAAAGLVLAGCSAQERLSSRVDPKYGVSASPKVVADGEPIPRGGGVYRVGRPYTIGGRMYVPKEDARGHVEEGIASWYGDGFHGRRTANGEIYDMNSISAAHPTLPIPSYARVTNLGNRRSIVVRVNDRGPFHDNRVIDLSVRTAQLLNFHANGIARVRVEYIGPAALEGSDDNRLVATLRDNGEPAPAPSNVMVASAAPFLPRAAAPSPVLRGPAPLPPDRPFEFGAGENPLASADLGGGARRERRAALEPAEPPRPAFVAAEPAGAGFAFGSGRGLY